MAVQDILLNDDNDLQITDGELVIGDSDQQHVQLIIESYVGHWKRFPLLGVGLRKYQSSSGTDMELKRGIKLQLESDGYNVKSIIIKEGKVYIDAERI